MKRIVSMMLVLLLTLGLLPVSALKTNAATKVKVNATNFPDANFRNSVIRIIDVNGDGYLDASELCLESLAIGNEGITDLTGIEYFTSLKWLWCGGNKLTKLDLSKNTALTNLSCFDNSLKSLNLSKNTALTNLDCGSNSLSNLNLSANSRLEVLGCEHNKLTSLDLSNNPKISTLSCYDNYIPGLDLSNNPNLISAALSDESDEWTEGVISRSAWAADGYSEYCLTYDLSTALYTSKLTAKPTVTKQPANKSVAEGKKVSFTVQASNVTKYQWYYRTSGSDSWAAVSSAEGKKATYSLTAAARHDGYQYRCRVINPAGYVYSKTVTLSVASTAPSITTQPKNQTVSSGDTVKFTVKAAGGGLSYQWYYRTSGSGAWTAVSADSGKTASYSLKAAARHNGYQYRCKVTNAKGTVYSSAITLTVVTEKPSITTQPKNQVTSAGKTVKFTVKATGGSLSYQWYYRTSGSSAWTAVSASSGKTASYSLKATERHNGYQYRCKVTNLLGSVYSKTVTLTLISPLAITAQPSNQVVKAGDRARFSVKATGNDVSYQWYYMTSDVLIWKPVSAASGQTAAYSLTAEARHNGYQYRCKITDSSGSIYSDSVHLFVGETHYIPLAIELCNETGAAITECYLYQNGTSDKGNSLLAEVWPDKNSDVTKYKLFAYVLRPEGVKMDLKVVFANGSSITRKGLSLSNYDKLTLKSSTSVSNWVQESVADSGELAALKALAKEGRTADHFYPGFQVFGLELKNKTGKQDAANGRYITEFYLYDVGSFEKYGNMVEFLRDEDGKPLRKWGYGSASQGGIYVFGFFVRPIAGYYEVLMVFEDGTSLVITNIELLTPDAQGFCPNVINIKDSVDPDFTEVYYDDGDPEPLQYIEESITQGVSLDRWYPKY